MTNAAIYVRVSSSQQETDGTSLDTQLERCRTYAAEQGLMVSEAHVFRETHTGIELWERPKLTALRDVVRRRQVGMVIAYAIDRLSRDPVHLGVVVSEAEHAGVDVRFVTEPLDDSPEGALIRFIRGYAAKVEHEKFSERAWRGRLERARSGKPLSAPRPPYGLLWNSDKSGYMADPVTSLVVRRIFREYFSGATLRAVVKNLNAEGVPTVMGGKLWHPSAVFEILKRRAYIGEVAALRWKTAKEGGKIRRLERPESEQIRLPDGVAPVLVDREIFDSVQERLTTNKQRSARNNRYPEAALLRGGFARCGYCGRTMVVCNAGTTYGCNSGFLV